MTHFYFKHQETNSCQINHHFGSNISVFSILNEFQVEKLENFWSLLICTRRCVYISSDLHQSTVVWCLNCLLRWGSCNYLCVWCLAHCQADSQRSINVSQINNKCFTMELTEFLMFFLFYLNRAKYLRLQVLKIGLVH